MIHEGRDTTRLQDRISLVSCKKSPQYSKKKTNLEGKNSVPQHPGLSLNPKRTCSLNNIENSFQYNLQIFLQTPFKSQMHFSECASKKDAAVSSVYLPGAYKVLLWLYQVFSCRIPNSRKSKSITAIRMKLSTL